MRKEKEASKGKITLNEPCWREWRLECPVCWRKRAEQRQSYQLLPKAHEVPNGEVGKEVSYRQEQMERQGRRGVLRGLLLRDQYLMNPLRI